MPLPHFAPLRLDQISNPFSHSDCLFELKYDGFGALLYLEKGRSRLLSRNGRIHFRFARLAAALSAGLGVHDAVLDGEIVCLDDQGRPQFARRLPGRQQPCFAAFDLLWLNGQDYRPMPLLARKTMLARIVPDRSTKIFAVQHRIEAGVELFAEACRNDMGGIVAKHSRSPYRLLKGHSPWLKIKNPGCSHAAGRRDLLGRGRTER